MRKNITWKNFKVGDTIITLGGEQYRVLGKKGNIIARSASSNFDTFQTLMTIEEAEGKGWRFIQPKGEIPMTKEEVEKFFGRPIRIIN